LRRTFPASRCLIHNDDNGVSHPLWAQFFVLFGATWWSIKCLFIIRLWRTTTNIFVITPCYVTDC
jgi:hypothetical protein